MAVARVMAEALPCSGREVRPREEGGRPRGRLSTGVTGTLWLKKRAASGLSSSASSELTLERGSDTDMNLSSASRGKTVEDDSDMVMHSDKRATESSA